MAKITDQFGREYERQEDFSPAKMTRRHRLCDSDTGAYVGAVVQWEGIGWTHTLHRFGEPALPTRGAAWAAFMRRAGKTCSLDTRESAA